MKTIAKALACALLLTLAGASYADPPSGGGVIVVDENGNLWFCGFYGQGPCFPLTGSDTPIEP
jgi:hypothetical protein